MVRRAQPRQPEPAEGAPNEAAPAPAPVAPNARRTRGNPAPRRRARTAPPEGETSRQRFERIGSARMQRAIYNIRLLGNLANGNYNYTNEDVALMRATLMREVEAVTAKFKPKEGRKDKSVVEFRFAQPVHAAAE